MPQYSRTVGTTPTLLVASNNRRMTITFNNNGGYAVYLGNNRQITTGVGFPLPIGASQMWTFKDDGKQVRENFFGVAAANVDVRVTTDA